MIGTGVVGAGFGLGLTAVAANAGDMTIIEAASTVMARPADWKSVTNPTPLNDCAKRWAAQACESLNRPLGSSYWRLRP